MQDGHVSTPTDAELKQREDVLVALEHANGLILPSTYMPVHTCTCAHPTHTGELTCCEARHICKCKQQPIPCASSRVF